MRFIFVLILVLLPVLGFTQDGGEGENPELNAETEDEKTLRELDENREERQKVISSLEKVGEGSSSGPTLDPNEQLEKLGYGLMNPGALFSLEAMEMMEKLIKEARMWEIPEQDVRDQVLKSVEGQPIESFVKRSPRLQGFLVDFMRDKNALLYSIAIFKDRARLKIYLYFWIGIMFSAYYTKRLFISKYWKRPVKILASLMFTLTVSTITLSTFCLIFAEEMKPIITLVKKHF